MSNIVSQGFAPVTLDEAMKFSEMLAKSSMVPKAYQGKAEDVLVACQWGREIGLAPMQALQNIAVINGKPSVYGDAAMALVQASSVCEGIEEYFENPDTMQMVAVCVANRRGRKPVVAKFSISDAKRAGLWEKQGPWTAYPKRMLQMRARGFALRDAFPDVLKGLITAEEAADYPDEERVAKDITPRNPLDALAAPSLPEPAEFNGTWSPEIDEPDVPEHAYVDETTQVAAEVTEQAVVEQPPSWVLHIPSKDPQTFETQAEWASSYEEMGAKVMASKKEPEAKLAWLDKLRDENADVLKRMTIENRLAHTQSYAKRKAELGLG